MQVVIDGGAVTRIPKIGLIHAIPTLTHVHRLQARVDAAQNRTPRLVVVDAPA